LTNQKIGRGLTLEKDKNRGVQRIVNAFGYTFAGLKAAWIYEEAFRQEIILLALVIPLGIWIGASSTQRAILIGFYLFIPLTELLNSSIEAVVDRMGEEHHVLSGRAKDLGSAAVFLSICITVITWSIIACERFL
jgi:diacylglycerol kinase (ATP)